MSGVGVSLPRSYLNGPYLCRDGVSLNKTTTSTCAAPIESQEECVVHDNLQDEIPLKVRVHELHNCVRIFIKIIFIIVNAGTISQKSTTADTNIIKKLGKPILQSIRQRQAPKSTNAHNTAGRKNKKSSSINLG